MTEYFRKHLYKKCVAKLDEIENGGFDTGDWSIEDAYTEGAVFGYEILEQENNRLARHIGELQKDKGNLVDENKKLQRACKKWFDKARESRKEVVKLLVQNEQLKKQILVWHDLRKDPNDLPEKVGNYLVCYISDVLKTRDVFELEFVDFLEDSHWIDETTHEIEKFDEGVIAWAEIPEFKE